MNFRPFFSLFIILIATLNSFGQKTVSISGIVVDSVTLVALPNTHVRIKSSGAGMVAGQSGSFKINAPVFDTLIFSCIGYETLEYPVLLSEEDVLIRLTESFVMLPEITTVGARLTEVRYAERRPVKSPTPTLAEGIFSPFTYFSKTEKEKRKLIKLTEENRKIRTYVEVVNDPELKKDMMNEFSISESTYYTLLAKFNQENRYAQYLVSEQQILKVLTAFIKKELNKK